MRPPSGADTSRSRALAACIVVAGHALLLVLAWHGAFAPRWLLHGDDPALTWIELQPSIAEPPPTATSSTTRADRTPATDLRNRRDETRNAVSAAPEPASLPPRQTDWSAHAAYNAKKAVEDAVTERYRNLGPRKPGPAPEPSAPSIFESPGKSFGELDTDINDNPVVWLNENCYFELDKLVPTARDVVNPGLPPMMKCKFNVGRREPRGDLFKPLERDRPLPELKPGVTPELPERDGN
ncbi:MAG TPA: hypothetical protein PKE27_04715 [Povalibacter sp.]|uniref:hypothetical protein n=1 Tax=Povalibacter sp. TaxID=1962978 RepID=UPI002C291CF7|nr:hypothetical protein [Povalibacter sp.]HMN43848.1 hypothetical protein [Povalibacter sp.]